MKKINFVFIMVVTCMILCSACATEKPKDITQVHGEIQESLDEKQPEESSMVQVEFHITVNPELKLFTNADGTVQNVQCINEHAEIICQDLKMEGIAYAEAFSLLVEKMHAEGYMKDREVMIRVIIPEKLGAEVPDWQNAVEKAWLSALEKQNAPCSFIIQLEVREHLEEAGPDADLPEQETLQDSPEDDDRFEKVERDSNGNITMTVEKDADGNMVTVYYRTYPQAKEVLVEFLHGGFEQFFYNSKGILDRKIFADAQGPTVEQFYENDALTKELVNGGEEERVFENGVLRHEIQNLVNNRVEHFYDAQGVLERVVETGQTSTITAVYHPDGWLLSHRFENSEGFWENIYQADGVLLSEENSAEGIKFIYDMSGNMVEAYGPDNYGRESHVFWLADRTAVIYVHEFDGTVTKSVQAPNNGSILSEIQNYTGAETAEIGTIVVTKAHE